MYISEEYKLKYILLTVHSPRVCGSVGSTDTNARPPIYNRVRGHGSVSIVTQHQDQVFVWMAVTVRRWPLQWDTGGGTQDNAGTSYRAI